MKTLRQLEEERAQVLVEMDALVKKAEQEKRQMNEEEFNQFEALQRKIDGEPAQDGKPAVLGLDAEIERARKIDRTATARAMAAGFQTGESVQTLSENDKKAIRSFSVLRMIQSKLEGGKPLEGIELEMHNEARNEMKNLGQEIRGLGIPSIVTGLGGAKRDNSITMPTQPEDGSILVEKDVRMEPSMMQMLRNALVTGQLGATVLNDLVGNVAFTRMIERPKASWKPEVGALDKSNVKFAADELSPKRLGTYTIQSMQFLLQTSDAVERMIRQEIVYSLSEGVDIAAILGTGTNNQPMGILNHPGIAALNLPGLGANGAAATRGNLIALRTALLKRNIRPGGNVKWLMNAATEGVLSNTVIAPGSDKFILEGDRLLGYPYVMSNMVPSDLDKGTTNDSLSALIFGAWAELFIAQWGGIDLLVDNITLAVDGQVKIVAQGFFNTLVHRPEAFAYYKDVVTTLA